MFVSIDERDMLYRAFFFTNEISEGIMNSYHHSIFVGKLIIFVPQTNTVVKSQAADSPLMP